ncbi:hypothetical protein [Protaetiibacter mangrovi]|uniref:hypothetical protein n=1 Tax=Protaetiibacter mangrovi TaxID=2970926 RepID=UPI0021615A5A|nr:hypothetical protein [Protaetiibacter mangrovi]
MEFVELPPGVRPAIRVATRALLRSCGPPLAALVAVGAVAAGLGMPVAAHGVAVLLIVLLAVPLHELGHLTAYRMIAPRAPAHLASGVVHAALRREPLPRRRDRQVTLAGPLAPLLLVVAAAPACAVAPAEFLAAIAVAVAHALGLVLPTADRRAWRAAAPPRSPTRGTGPTLGA